MSSNNTLSSDVSLCSSRLRDCIIAASTNPDAVVAGCAVFVRPLLFFLVLLFLFVRPAGVLSDGLADGTWLASLYNATNGSGWSSTCRSGWNVSNPTSVCSTSAWYGVQCNASDGTGVVTSVDLDNCDLRGGPLPDLPILLSSPMDYCRTLKLYSNGITGALPLSWSRMSSLMTLSLYDNSLSGTLPASWSSMSSMQSLHLHTNRLTGTVQTSWSNLSSLQLLDLHDNTLTGPLPASWSSMPLLMAVYLNTNGLSGTLHSSWHNMPSIKYLYLHFNSLSGPLPTSWSSMSSMKELVMYANKLSGTLPLSWSSMSSMTLVNLAYNSLTGTLPASWYLLVPFQNNFFQCTYNYFLGDIPQSWLWSNATIGGDYFTSNCLNVSNTTAVSATGRFFNVGGTPRSNPSICAVIAHQQAVAASPTLSESVTTETLSASASASMTTSKSTSMTTSKSTSMTTSRSTSMTTSRSTSMMTTKSATASRSETTSALLTQSQSTSPPPSSQSPSESFSTAISASTSFLTEGRKSTNSSRTEIQNVHQSRTQKQHHSLSLSAETPTISTTSPASMPSSMTETVTNTLSDTWCMFPSPMHRFVKEVTIPELWTATSNGDAGSAVPARPSLRKFNEYFSTVTVSEVLSIVYQKQPDANLPPSINAILVLSSQYAARDAVGRKIRTAVDGRLSVELTVSAPDKLQIHCTIDSGAVSAAMYVSQTVVLDVDFASFVCFDWRSLPFYIPNVTVSVMLIGAPLIVPLSTLSAATSISSMVAMISGSPATAAVTSRLTLLSGYIECQFDPVLAGKDLSMTRFYYGNLAGQYLRGAVVGNVAVLYGVSAGLVVMSGISGCVVALFREVSVRDASLMILDMMHVPSVFSIPLAMTLQPTVTAAVQLIFVRAGGTADVVVAVLGLFGVMFFVMFFSFALLQIQPWSLQPRNAASLDKRIKIYGSGFFWLQGKRSRFRDHVAKILFAVFESREHWGLIVNRPEFKRAKRRLLLLFEDTRRMWFPVSDLWTSVAVALIAGLAPLNSMTVCFGQLVATSMVFVALILIAFIARPLFSRWGNSYLAFVNVCNLCSTLSLLVNNVHTSGTSVGIATLSLMINGVAAALVSLPGFIRLLLRLFSSIERVIATFPPRRCFSSIDKASLYAETLKNSATNHEAMPELTEFDDPFFDAPVTTYLSPTFHCVDSLSTGVAFCEPDGIQEPLTVHEFIRNLILTSIVGRVVMCYDCRFGRAHDEMQSSRDDAAIFVDDSVVVSWHQQLFLRQQDITNQDDDVVQLLMTLQPQLLNEEGRDQDSECFSRETNPLLAEIHVGVT